MQPQRPLGRPLGPDRMKPATEMTPTTSTAPAPHRYALPLSSCLCALRHLALARASGPSSRAARAARSSGEPTGTISVDPLLRGCFLLACRSGADGGACGDVLPPRAASGRALLPAAQRPGSHGVTLTAAVRAHWLAHAASRCITPAPAVEAEAERDCRAAAEHLTGQAEEPAGRPVPGGMQQMAGPVCTGCTVLHRLAGALTNKCACTVVPQLGPSPLAPAADFAPAPGTESVALPPTAASASGAAGA